MGKVWWREKFKVGQGRWKTLGGCRPVEVRINVAVDIGIERLGRRRPVKVWIDVAVHVVAVYIVNDIMYDLGCNS